MSFMQIILILHTADLRLLRLELTCRISFRSWSFSFLQTSLVYFEDLECDIDFSVMKGPIFTNVFFQLRLRSIQ